MPDSRWSLGFRVPSAEAVPRLVTTVYNPSDSISWKCSTGNCTFPEYGTLEYCSSCEDFSASILFNNTKKESGLPLKDFLAGPQPENSLWLNMTYSSRSNGTSLDDTATISTDLCTAAFVSRGISGGTTVSAILVGKTDNSAPGRFAGCENPGPRDSWRCRGYGAAVCTVHPCVRTYKAYIKAGRLDQHMVSQSDFMIQGIGRNKPLGEWLGMVDTQCVTEDEIKELQQQGSKSDRSSRWLVINDSHFDAPFARLALDSLYSSLLARKCLYLVDRFSSASIVERALTNDLYGQIRGTHIRLIPPYLGATEQFTDYHLTGPNALHLLYKNNDIDLEWIQSSFANFSSTLSIWVRTYGSERNSEPAIGEVWHYATCLRVGWRWLCFPAVLVGATILFFFMVVFTTDRQQLSIWKLSPLPWILRGNGKEAGLAGRGETTIVAMEQKSKEMMITLLKGSGPRIQLVESEDEKRSDERITNIEDVENSVSIEGGTDMIVNDETRSD
ncbi:hypothetical protein B0J14DRAFT_641662 [Halenospora varia]|nr:hypothetical protein B0J14DRAFT_641662 [Halenospora varia]